MKILRRGRFVIWLARDLSTRYTRALAGGFFIGLVVSYIFWQLYPFIAQRAVANTQHIGIVTSATPSTLPLSIQNQISMGLTAIGEKGSAEPALAESWEATDSGRLFIFHLRKDATWQNGKHVTAYDVNYNIKNVQTKVLDDYTLSFQLPSSYSPFPLIVSKPLFKTGLVGCGTYKISNMSVTGDTIQMLELIPFDTSSRIPIKKYHFYQTEQLAIDAYKLGEIDRVEELSTEPDVHEWSKNTTVEIHVKHDRIIAALFNLDDQLMHEKNVRQALGYALPSFSEEQAVSPLSKTSWAYTDKVRIYDHDPEQVKKLLSTITISSQSGELLLTTFSRYMDTAQSIATSWTAAGFKTSVRVENSIPSSFQVLLTAIDVPPDPDQYVLWHSTQQSTNISGYVNVKIDKLLEDGRQALYTEERKKIYADFARRLVDDAPALFLYYPKTYTILRK